MRIQNLQTKCDDMLERLYLLTGVVPQEHKYCAPEVFSLFLGVDALGITPQDIDCFQLGTLGLEMFTSPFEVKILRKLKPTTFDDLLKVCGIVCCHRLGSYSFDTWLQVFREKDLITYPEEIFRLLRKYGVSVKSAFELSQKAGASALGREYGDEKYIQEMKQCGVPDEYISFLKDVCTLPAKLYEIENLQSALQLAWFKIYHPAAFYSAYFSAQKRHDDYFTFPKDALEMAAMLQAAPTASPDEPHEYTPERCFLLTIKECMARDIQFLPPEKGKSHLSEFLPEDNNLRMPLDTLHYVV